MLRELLRVFIGSGKRIFRWSRGVSRPSAFLLGGVGSQIEGLSPNGWERDYGHPDALRTGGLFVRGAVTAGRSAVCEPVVRARVRRRTSGWDPADLG